MHGHGMLWLSTPGPLSKFGRFRTPLVRREVLFFEPLRRSAASAALDPFLTRKKRSPIARRSIVRTSEETLEPRGKN